VFSKLKDWLDFVRWPNLIMVMATMWLFRISYFKYYLSEIPFGTSLADFWLLVLDVVLVTIAGNVINDYYDNEIDAINKSKRFLVQHPGFKKKFFWFYYTLLGLGLLLTLYLGLRYNKIGLMLFYPISIALLWFYAAKLKSIGFIGNLLVSVFIAFIPWLVLLSELQNFFWLKKNQEFIQGLSLYSMMMLFSNISREIIKDIEDVKGDSSVNMQTLPIRLGIKKAAYLASLALLIALSFHINYWLGVSFFRLESFLLAGFIGVFACSLCILMLRINESKHAAQISLLLKIFMLFALLQIPFMHG